MARVALEDWQEQIRDQKIECMSRDEMTALQRERLVRQVKNVYENVAFGSGAGRYQRNRRYR